MRTLTLITALICTLSLPTVATASPINLVINGDFEAGNTAFATDYTYLSAPVPLFAEGVYGIRVTTMGDHPYWVGGGDHTTGSGLLMLINGAPDSGLAVWEQTVAVAPNTWYEFGGYMINVCCIPGYPGNPAPPAQFNYTFNGTTTYTTPVSNLGTWTPFAGTWYSGSSTDVVLRITDQEIVRDGNDFGLDDLYLQATVDPSTVPEPATLVLLGAGLLMIVARRLRVIIE